MALNIPSAPYDPTPITTQMSKQNALTQSALENKAKSLSNQSAAAALPYAGQLAQATAAEKSASANKAVILNNLFNQWMGSQGQGNLQGVNAVNNTPTANAPADQRINVGNPVGNGQMPMANGQGANQNALVNPPSSGNPPSNGSANIPTPGAQIGAPALNPNITQPNQGKMDYPQAAMMMSYAGLGQPQIADVNGQKIAITPFGNIPVAQGLSPSQEAYQAGKGKYAADAYGANIDAYRSLENQMVPLQNIIDAVKNNPEFYNVAGPVASFFKTWTGTPEQKRILGQLTSSGGEVVLQTAGMLKGPFRAGEQDLVDETKANIHKDMGDAFVGKLQSQYLIKSVLADRRLLAARYINQGMDVEDAEVKAAQETPLLKYKDQIEKMIAPKKWYVNDDTGERKRLTDEEAKELMKAHK